MDPIALDEITADIYAGPLHHAQAGLGASFYEDLGSLWTKDFGDAVSEYWAVRSDVGVWDVSALAKWHFTGPGALAALDRLTTRRILGVRAGSVRYGAVLNDRGLMLDEGTVFVVSEEEAYYFGNDTREPFARHIEGHAGNLDVRIEDVTWSMPNIAVAGPKSFRLLSGLCDADLGSLGYFRFFSEPVEIAGVRGLLSRTGFTGELGYEFFIERPDDAERVWSAVIEAGAKPFAFDSVEMMRIEAGLLIADEDYVPGETGPFDVSLDQFIDLGRDFVGRAAVSPLVSNPPRRLMTLDIESPEVPERGTEVLAGDDPVGVITSAADSPRFGVLALAILNTPAARKGTRVRVLGSDARIYPVPIDDPFKLRPRSDPRNPVTAG